MSERPKGYGLTAELDAKVVIHIVEFKSGKRLMYTSNEYVYICIGYFVNVCSGYPLQKAAKYDYDLAAEAVAWIEEITGEAIGGPSPDEVHDALKDGVTLCK